MWIYLSSFRWAVCLLITEKSVTDDKILEESPKWLFLFVTRFLCIIEHLDLKQLILIIAYKIDVAKFKSVC